MKGRTVGRYQVEGRASEDATAVVYRVQHVNLGSTHRLKVLKAGRKGAELLERLERQGEVQAKLRHPNILPVTDVVDVDGQPGLVLAWEEGPDLRAWVDARLPQVELAVDVFRGLLRGAAAAHAEGLVHRDLRPENIVLHRTESGEMVPRIADFGLVKVLGSAGLGTRPDAFGADGTASYAAPELLTDPSGVDLRADVFSLGAVLYFLLTGHDPFHARGVKELLDVVSRGAYRPLGDRAQAIPEHLQLLLHELLAADPAARIPDCTVALAMLDAPDLVRAAHPTHDVPVPPDPSPVDKSGIGVFPYVALAAIGLLLVLAASLIWS